MNPFEKRDKIHRTPPGETFLDYSSCIVDESVDYTSCSIYDNTGIRASQVPTAVKQYTITFEATKGESVRYSWLTDKHQVDVFTSSPFRGEAQKRSLDIASCESNDEADMDKENMQPPLASGGPTTVEPRPKRPQAAATCATISPTTTAPISAKNESSVMDTSDLTKARQARSRRCKEQPTEQESLQESIPSTRRRGRRATELDSLQSSHGSESKTEILKKRSGRRAKVIPDETPTSSVTRGSTAIPETPKTIVAKPRQKRTQPISTNTTIDATPTTSPPVTVIRRKTTTTVRKPTTRQQSHIEEEESLLVPETVIRPRGAPEQANQVCHVALDVLNLSAISPVLSRGRQRGATQLESSSIRSDPKTLQRKPSGRRAKQTAPVSQVTSASHRNVAIPVTPETIVAKPRQKRTQPISKDTTFDATPSSSPPVTVIRRKTTTTVRKRTTRQQSHIEEEESVLAPETVIRSRVPSKLSDQQCCVTLDVLNVSAINSAAPSRGRKRVLQPESDAVSDTIATRLRVRPSQMSYADSISSQRSTRLHR